MPCNKRIQKRLLLLFLFSEEEEGEGEEDDLNVKFMNTKSEMLDGRRGIECRPSCRPLQTPKTGVRLCV